MHVIRRFLPHEDSGQNLWQLGRMKISVSEPQIRYITVAQECGWENLYVYIDVCDDQKARN